MIEKKKIFDEFIIKCLCGRRVKLKRVGGQYQHEYQNRCECGRIWFISEVSELQSEIE